MRVVFQPCCPFFGDIFKRISGAVGCCSTGSQRVTNCTGKNREKYEKIGPDPQQVFLFNSAPGMLFNEC